MIQANDSDITDCFLIINGTCFEPTGPTAEEIEQRNHAIRMTKIEISLHAISFICVYLSIILLLFLRLRSTVKSFLHKQLLVSRLFGEIVYFLLLDDLLSRIQLYQDACLFMLVVTTYFNITLFTTMMVEGLYICMKITSVFDTHSKKIQCYVFAAIAWGLPGVIVLIELVIWFDKYQASTSCEFYDNDIWLYKGPVAAILIINLICCLYILYIAIKQICLSKKYSSNWQKTFGTIRAMLVLYPLLGVTYIVGFFIDEDIVFIPSLYTFAILNGSLGIWFFVFHIIYDNQTRKAIMKEIFGIVSNDSTTTTVSHMDRSKYREERPSTIAMQRLN